MITNISSEREREIWNEAYEQGKRSLLVELFEKSDKKGVIRALWSKAMKTLSDEEKPFTDEQIEAYATGVLHCYNIMKSDHDALETHIRNGKKWDNQPVTDTVYFSLTKEEVSQHGYRSGH
jgi:hypothetical protein